MNTSKSQVSSFLLAISSLILIACVNLQGEQEENEPDSSLTDTPITTNQGVEFFQGSFQGALAYAAQTEKLVFVYAYDNSGRGANIVMEDAVFPLPNIGEYINERFVSVKFDLNDEELNGSAIATRYKFSIPPTFLILDTEGREVGRAQDRYGALPNQFLSMISRLLGESSSTIDEMQAKYDSGERSPEFVQEFLMQAIIERALLNVDSEEDAQIWFEESAKYRHISKGYFASKSHSELINEIDAHLVMYYWDGMPRGDELVEFVMDHFEKFLAVSSVSSLAQFTLFATWSAAGAAAQAGDENYSDYIAALEDYPLHKAVEYERHRLPSSNFLPDRMNEDFKPIFLAGKQDWDGYYDLYKKKLEEGADDTLGREFLWAMIQLSRSDNAIHHELAIELGQRGFEKDKNDPYNTATYIQYLVILKKPDEARRVAEEYRSRLSDSEADEENLMIFNESTEMFLNESN
ncbi:MAG: hypothetical protein OXH31_08270 [Gammaproteobacteria bacterium]|nr:hypothetical protein [Gammaproteobacteria bacterium]